MKYSKLIDLHLLFQFFDLGDDTSNNETDAPSPDGPRERPEFTRLSARQRQEFPRLQQVSFFFEKERLL